MDVERIGSDFPLLNPIAAPLTPQPRRELLGRPLCRRGSRVLGVACSIGDGYLTSIPLIASSSTRMATQSSSL
jgi:hypothetical protein